MNARVIDPEAVRLRAEQLQSKLSILRGQLAERASEQGHATERLPIGDEKKVSPSVDSAAIQRNPNRPKSLDEVVGQHDLVQRLRLVTLGAMARGERQPHCLLVGSPGAGKTTLAQIIADEVCVPMIQTTGMLLKKSPDLIGLIVSTEGKPTLLFVDEIHSAAKVCQETLYTVLEDGCIDALAGSGPDTVATTIALPGLIIVGATTSPGKLTQPFRDRFGFVGQMAPYSDAEIAEIVGRFWKAQNMPFAKSETLELARRSKGIPRRCLHLSERVLDFAAVSELPKIEPGTTADALSIFGVNSRGMDENDMAVVRSLVKDFAGRPIGVDALAHRLALDVTTLSNQIEPWLAQSGFLVRTKTGRVATAKAHELIRMETAS